MSELNVVVLSDSYDEDVLLAALRPGSVATYEGESSIYLRNEGEIDELAPDEHSAYVEVGTVHGRPAEPDEPDIDDDGYLISWMGRLGDVYFERRKADYTWEQLGRLGSDESAIEFVCGSEFDFQRE